MFHKVGGQIENWGRFSCRHTGRQRKGKERKDPGISTFGLSRKFSDPICSRHDLCRATFVARQVFNFSQLNKNPFYTQFHTTFQQFCVGRSFKQKTQKLLSKNEKVSTLCISPSIPFFKGLPRSDFEVQLKGTDSLISSSLKRGSCPLFPKTVRAFSAEKNN